MDEQGNEQVDELDLEPAMVVRNRRPRALWGALVAVVVAAGALAVTSGGDDDTTRPGLPVDLAFGASASSGASEDAARPAWVSYEAGEDLPALGGSATAYRQRGTVDEAEVQALADALGLDGDVQSDASGSWWVDGGRAGRLDVYGASWSFFAGERDCLSADGSMGSCVGSSSSSGSAGPVTTIPAECPPNAECAAPGGGVDGCEDVVTATTVTADGDVSVASPPATACAPLCSDGDDCIDGPGPAADRIPEADARRIALAVVAAAGADVDGARVDPQSTSDDSSWYVTVEPVLGDLPSGLVSFVEVGSDERVLAGSGHLGQPEALGDYPLLDTRAVIDRANDQSGAASIPDRATDLPAPVETTVAGDDTPNDTAGCVDADCDEPLNTTVTTLATPPTTPPCKPQPDGREICEQECADLQAVDGTVPAICLPPCPEAVPGEDIAVGAPDRVDCPTPNPLPEPLPEPEPLVITLVSAEPSLVLLPATDGSGDAYLVPAYRFTDADGGQVDLPAVADEALAGPVSTDTTVPDTLEPDPVPTPTPDPGECEVLEEDIGSGSTHTIQTCFPPDELTLAIGEGYYVDIDVECAGGSFRLGGDVWVTDDEDVAGWADPGERHEGGTFTLDTPDHGTFVGDAAGTLTAEFRALGPAEDIFCAPEPR